MRIRQLLLVTCSLTALMTSSVLAQSAASCKKAEFRGGSPVFYYDKACLAKVKAAQAPASNAPKKNVAKTAVKAVPNAKVRSVQKLLAKQGYKPGAADGLMGGNTSRAINQYYRKHGLKKGSGSKMSAVLAHLKAKPAKSKNSKKIAKSNPRLKQIQRLLAKKGAYSGKQTGVMDKPTRLAVMSYYKKHKLDRGNGTTLDAVRNHLRGKKSAKVAAKKAPAKAVAKKVAAKKAAPAVKSDAQIGRLQLLLAQEGKYSGSVDGVMNGATRKAMSKYASDNKISDGKNVQAVLKHLNSAGSKKVATKAKAAPAKKAVAKAAPAKSDPQVADLQSLLAKKGKYSGPTDGIMNIATRSAMIKYYHENDVDIGKGTIAQGVHKHLKGGGTAKVAAKAKKAAPAKVATKAKAAPVAKSDAQIGRLQLLLAQEGKYSGSVDGVMNGATRKAMSKYASDNKISDGKNVQSVLKHLNSAGSKKVAAKAKAAPVAKKVAAKPAAKAAAVKSDPKIADLQSLLAKKGKYSGPTDGTMNIATRSAMIKYYHENDVDIGKGTIAEGVHKHLKGGGAPKASAKAPAKKAAPAKAASAKKSGSDIGDIQSMLQKKGQYSGSVDGKMNAPTRKAILSYYKKNKLKRAKGQTIVGSVSQHLKSGGSAKSATATKSKDSGYSVNKVQKMLAAKGLYQGPIDGRMTSPTRKSVLGYYKKNKLKRANDTTIMQTVYHHLKTHS